MTCIVGLEQNGQVYIGGDSAGVQDKSIQIRKDPKVFQVGEFLIGFTTSFRMGQILNHGFKAPKQASTKTDMAYLVTDFTKALRKSYSTFGYKPDEESYGDFLLGYRGQLYSVQADLQICKASNNYYSIGSGSDFALGALFASEATEDPISRVQLALTAASKFSTEVAPPFLILTLEEKRGKRRH